MMLTFVLILVLLQFILLILAYKIVVKQHNALKFAYSALIALQSRAKLLESIVSDGKLPEEYKQTYNELRG